MAKIPDRKNMTTADILAFCRAEVGGGGASDGAPEAAAEESTAAEETAAVEETAEEEAPAAEKPAAPAKKPTSTADILAAARASAGGGGAAKKEAAPKADKSAAKASPGKKPTSTKDILAAARAAASGGGAAKEDSAKPTAAKAKKAAPAAGASGEKPSVQEMLAAFRNERQAADKGVEATSPEGKKVPPKMPVPPRKPKMAKPAPAPVNEERRSFLASLLVVPSAFVAAWAMFTATSLAWLLGAVRYALPNVLVEPPSKFKIGAPSNYDFGTVSTKWKAQRGIWVVHTDRYKGQNIIVALSTVCTHLGCTPNWLEGEQKFKCPCHGSGFYIDGINFEGPAPRPLERVAMSVAADGMLEVDKSIKFQEELGQWEDPNSYVQA